MNSGKLHFTELSLTDKLLSFRSEQENFISLSFASIVAFNEHGALPHYTATPKTDIPVTEGLLLVDSGNQYFEGTTDITRTIHLGNVTAGQKKDFTLVLKGMIALSKVVFPAGTYGYQLDLLARKALWENGLNYGHGTGHGVGFCLSVHEGPQRISPLAAVHKESFFRPGMIVSDEPAIYREGEYGIRTENLLLCYEDEETMFGKFLRFHTLTLCYIDQDLIDFSLLDKSEKEWLDKYHEEVYEKLNPFLTPEESAWLKEKTIKR
jgi:Xaa-Pro aminopeptidase